MRILENSLIVLANLVAVSLGPSNPLNCLLKKDRFKRESDLGQIKWYSKNVMNFQQIWKRVQNLN
jgi:hypothetical protein